MDGALADLGLDDRVDYVLGDAGTVLDRYADLEFVLIDCEKEDYVRFFGLLRLAPARSSSRTTSCRMICGSMSAMSERFPASNRSRFPSAKGSK